MIELLELAREISDYAICGEGNVSVRDGNNFKIKSSGTSLRTLSEDDLTLCDIDGNQLDESHKKPSIEVCFHSWIMKTFPEINFIAHTHPTETCKILCSSEIHEFSSIRLFPDQVVRNGVKSCVVPYASPGEKLLSAIETSVSHFINHEGYFPKLILMQNHGIIVAASSAKDCIASTHMCEKSAEIYIGAKSFTLKTLNKEHIMEIDSDPREKYRRELLK